MQPFVIPISVDLEELARRLEEVDDEPDGDQRDERDRDQVHDVEAGRVTSQCGRRCVGSHEFRSIPLRAGDFKRHPFRQVVRRRATIRSRAEVAELADAVASKAIVLRDVWVRAPPSALACRVSDVLPVIIFAAIAIPLLIVAFMGVKRSRASVEHAAEVEEGSRAEMEREFAAADAYEEQWRAEQHSKKHESSS